MRAFDFEGANTCYGTKGENLYVPLRKRDNGSLSSQWTLSLRERLILLFGGQIGVESHDAQGIGKTGHYAFVLTRKGHYVDDYRF
jgi:hypothetical protein